MTPECRADEVLARFDEAVWPDWREGQPQQLTWLMSEAIRAAVEEEREACAALVDARNNEVLARQYGVKDVYTFQADVDSQIRMAAVLLPDIAAAIRKRGQQ